MTRTYAARKALGDHGEELAVRHLQAHGYAVLDRNWRCPEGEIDVVARLGRTIVICEVKTRASGRYGSPLEAISQDKAARLYRLARAWCAAHPIRYDNIRVDVIAIVWSGRGPGELEHLEGVA